MLRLLSKVAFIFNVCFLLASAMRLISNLQQTEIVSLIIVSGYILAIIVGAVVNVWLAIFWILYKSLPQTIPLWLIIINFLFLISEIIFFLK